MNSARQVVNSKAKALKMGMNIELAKTEGKGKEGDGNNSKESKGITNRQKQRVPLLVGGTVSRSALDSKEIKNVKGKLA